MANRYLIEKCLVEHCSATLASMKSANLFNMEARMWNMHWTG